jgi:hypothetical protein
MVLHRMSTLTSSPKPERNQPIELKGHHANITIKEDPLTYQVLKDVVKLQSCYDTRIERNVP